jgi:ABC-type antimicrobial peptide transport system permease subunit
MQRLARVLVRSPKVGQERQVTGIGADFIPMEGHAVARGRGFAARELEAGSPVAILGTEPAKTFFPDGDALGRTLVVGGIPVTVVGTFRPRVFRWREGQDNLFKWRNYIIALPAAFVQRRLQADPHQRLDVVAFKLPEVSGIQAFSDQLEGMLRTSHRDQNDFRLDDVAARARRMESQDRVYELAFLLSGILALLGGGIVNVNVQMASLKERVREVGLKMALGASGREVFKGFMTEAMLLTVLGTAAGLGAGAGFSWAITSVLGIPLYLSPDSFLWALLLAGVFGFAFALYPAWKASRLSPMEALRYE